VLTIGNVKLTRAQFEQWVATLPDNLKTMLNGPTRRKVVEQYAELTALGQEARKRKIDQKPMVAIQIDQALAQALIQDVSAGMKLDEAEMKAYYDQHKVEFESAKARHILIGVKPPGTTPTPGKKELTDEEALAKAKDIREKIVKGGDFAALAKTDSDDPGSKDTGGEYTVSHGQMVKEFDAAVWSLPINEVSQPVKTQFGYHVIQVQSRGMKTYDEAKPQIEAKMKPEMQKKAVEEAKKQVPVTISDDYFGKQ
jgi:foldase protein PrsA